MRHLQGISHSHGSLEPNSWSPTAMATKYLMQTEKAHLKHVGRSGIYQVQTVIPEPLRDTVAILTNKPRRNWLTHSTRIKGPPPPKDKQGPPIWPSQVLRAALPIKARHFQIFEAAR